MKTEKLAKASYGKRISLNEANGMIQEFIDLNAITVKSIKNASSTLADKTKVERATELNASNYNAFVFSKDLIQRFFDGSEEDGSNNPECANYLMIILGAHPTEKEGNPAGSLTVLTVGCRKKIDKDQVKFYPLNITNPANEYPPHKIVHQLGDEKEGFRPDDFFLVVE